MITKFVKSMHLINKHRANRISQSHNLVTVDIVDKIIKMDINSQVNRPS